MIFWLMSWAARSAQVINQKKGGKIYTMLTRRDKQVNLIPVSAKNTDGDSKPLLFNLGRTASVCDAIFVRELPDFWGGWSRYKGFSPRISAPVSKITGFEHPPALIVLKNDLGDFVQIFNLGGHYDEFNQISESEYQTHNVQRRELFEREPDWFLFRIGVSGKGSCKNLSETQKGIYAGNVDSRRNADDNGQQIDTPLFFAWGGIDSDVRANAGCDAVPSVHSGRFGRQAINKSSNRANERPQGGAVAALPRMGKDSSLSSGGAFRQGNRKSHRKIKRYRQSTASAYARLRLSRPFGFGTQIRSAFPAVRRVKQWEKSLKCPESGFINQMSAVKLKTRLKTVKSLLKIWPSLLKSAKFLTAINLLTFISPAAFTAAGFSVLERNLK